MVSSISSNTLRLTGLATGMDTDEMIKKMLLGQQAKIDKANQDKQRIVWKQELYKDIIKDIKELQNAYFNVTSKDNLNSNSNYSDYVSKLNSGSSATVTASQGAVEGNYKIDVEQLAKGARLTKVFEKDINLNSKILSANEDGSSVTKKFTIEYGDGLKSTIEISSEDTLKDVINNIKNIKVLDKENKIIENDKLSNHINVSFSELTGEFKLESKTMGKTSDLKIFPVEGEENFLSLEYKSREDAIAYITPPGGTRTKVERDSNNFIIDGVNYNLTGVDSYDKTEPERLPLTATEISITQDVDKTFDRIKTFFDKYNALVDKITKKLEEKKDYSYNPLTDDQKKDMNEDDIKAWEERAKKGILKNDDNLERMLSELRSTFFTPVQGSNLTFNRAELGLDTSNVMSKAGQIEFTVGGEEILKKALKERPEEIMNLFNKTYTLAPEDLTKSKTEQNKKISENSGIFQRVNNILKDYVGLAGTTLNNAILTQYANKQEDYSKSGAVGSNTLPDQIYRKNNIIEELNKKLKERENALYKQFATLEKVMNSYNSQSAWLMQQFGGGQ